MAHLSQSTIEQLKYYVYILIDPRTNKPFYVGKGHGDRVNNHEEWALDHELEQTRKLDTIRDILNSGCQVKQVIVRHGMSSEEAFEVECALIDYIGMNNLTNIVSGHYSADRGLMTLNDIEIKYQAENAVFETPALLININRLYHPDISDTELYEATCKHWVVDTNKLRSVPIVCAVFLGIIREVYQVSEWHKSPEEFNHPRKRSYFEGKVAEPFIRKNLINKSVTNYWKKGSQNPIKYVGLNNGE
jgi:hypothetical protein